MAEVRMQLGATADLVTTDEMSDALDSVVTGLQGHIDNRLGSQPKKTIRTLACSDFVTLTNGGSKQTALVPASPSVGKVWVVKRVTVTGGDDHSAVANMVAAVYAGDPYNFTLSQLVQPGIAVPYVDTWSTDSFVVHSSEQLFVNWIGTGNVNFQTVSANMQVQEWNEKEYESRYA
jgi:hypothetical protein